MPLLKWISNRVFNLKLNFTAKDTDGGTKINGCLGGETQSQTEQILCSIFSLYALSDWYIHLQHYSIDQESS